MYSVHRANNATWSLILEFQAFYSKAFQHALTAHIMTTDTHIYTYCRRTSCFHCVLVKGGVDTLWLSLSIETGHSEEESTDLFSTVWEAGLANLQGHNSKGASGEPLLCQKRGKAAQLLRHRLAFWSVHKLQSETEAFFDANGRSSKAAPKNISFFGTVMGLVLVLGNHTAKDCVKCPLRVLKSSRLHRCGHCTRLPATISESHTLAIKGLGFKLLEAQYWTTHC